MPSLSLICALLAVAPAIGSRLQSLSIQGALSNETQGALSDVWTAAATSGSCSYTDLLDAVCDAPTRDTVDVSFCGRVFQGLERKRMSEEAFQGVDWWQPETQGQELSPAESKCIKDYTGTFQYSRNIGMVLRGMAPMVAMESGMVGWREKSDCGELTKEVLTYAVHLGQALNKLPSPEKPRELFRGGWVPQSTAQLLLSKRTGMRLPYFQPTTSEYIHALFFMHDIFQPEHCRSMPGGCVWNEAAFPILYNFSTARAKDVTHWNEEEQEHILLPGLPFDVLSAEKVRNDPIAFMNNEEVAAWFNSTHTLPDWAFETWNIREAGPWPDAAAAMLASGVDGAAVAKAYEDGYTMQVGELLGIKDDYYNPEGLYPAMMTRFLLPKDDKSSRPSTVPYYIAVSLKDSAA